MRGFGDVTVLLYGSLESVDHEHARGFVEFSDNSGAEAIMSLPGQDKVEQPFNNQMSVAPGKDEIWLDGDVSHFWFTTNVADDGYKTGYAYAEHCGAKIIAHKIVCTDESELPNWGAGGPNIDADTAQDWVEHT